MREGKWLGGMPDGFSIPPRGLGWAWGSCEDFGAGCGLGSCALLRSLQGNPSWAFLLTQTLILFPHLPQPLGCSLQLRLTIQKS